MEICVFYEDDHSRLVIPVPIPNTEVKLPTPFVLVSHKMRSIGVVFTYFLRKT